jgi:hypothetical protein
MLLRGTKVPARPVPARLAGRNSQFCCTIEGLFPSVEQKRAFSNNVVLNGLPFDVQCAKLW